MRRASYRRIAGPVCLTAALLLLSHEAGRGEGPEAASNPSRRVRQPVALAIADGGKTLLVANRRSGSVSVVDAGSRRVVGEHAVGHGLADLAILPDGRHLLAVDQAGHDLVLLSYQDRSMKILERRRIGPDPVRLVVSSDGSSCVAASPWSRRLTFVGLTPHSPEDEHPGLALTGSLELPFSPRELAMFPGISKLVVADAFGGRLAVVDLARRSIDSVRTLPAHNIRGLAFSPDGRALLIAHQVLNRLAQASFDDVHWGLLIRNHLRVVQTEALLKAGSDEALLDGGRLFDLGDVGYAAGDPGAIAIDPRGNLIVALSGADEVAIAAGVGQGPRRIVVGRRPAAVAASPDGEFLYVADSLDDTISVVATATGQRPATIGLGPRPEPTAVDRGERLYYSAKVSHDGWMSCQSCHTDGHTNGLLSDTLGDGSYGAAKRVPSLLGVAATGPWTWTGSMTRLEDQVRKSIMTTMHGPKPTDAQVADLTAYLNTLAPPSPQLWDAEIKAPSVERGRTVFESRKCAACHIPPEYTSPQRYDVGLVDEVGNHEFNPPSLQAVSRRDALFHDGRVRSLEDVFQKERHPRGLALTPREIADLVAFLKTL
jgi:YVTN family beta-propeller protein